MKSQRVFKCFLWYAAVPSVLPPLGYLPAYFSVDPAKNQPPGPVSNQASPREAHPCPHGRATAI